MADRNPFQYQNNNWGNQRKYPNLDANGNFIQDPEMVLDNMWAGSMTGQQSNVFHDWLFPQVKEGRQMAEEMFLTDRQNAYNSASAQMARAKAAGINPLTAAGGIAGNGMSSATDGPQPAASVNPIGDVAGAVGDIADSSISVASLPSQIKRNKAEARNLNASATATEHNADRLADAEVFSKASSAAKSLSESGVPEIMAMELGLSLARNGLDGFSSAFNVDSYCRRYNLEMDKIDSEINAENARFENLQQLTNVYRSQAQLQAEKAMHENILRQFDSKRLEVAKKYEAMFADGDGLQQFILAQDFGYESKEYRAYMKFVQDKFYNQGLGGFNADKETAWERFKNQVEGSDYGRIAHAKSLADYENYKTLFAALADVYFGGTLTETGLLTKIFNICAQALHIPEEDFLRMFEDAYRPK